MAIMVDVTTEIIIDKPIDVVANYATNPENAPEWYVNIKSADWKTPKPLKVGSKVAFVAHFLGRQLTYTYEIVDFIPKRKLVMKTAEGPFPMETSYTWSTIGEDKTKMILRNSGKPKGFSKLFAPVMAKMMKKANNNDLVNIKKIIEER